MLFLLAWIIHPYASKILSEFLCLFLDGDLPDELRAKEINLDAFLELFVVHLRYNEYLEQFIAYLQILQGEGSMVSSTERFSFFRA